MGGVGSGKLAFGWRARTAAVAVLVGAVLFLAACGDSAPASTAAPNGSFTSVVNAVSPSVVLIQSAGGLGSGVVYDHSGDIVTNAHVLGDATQFLVTTWGGQRHAATLVGTYPASDIAVIKAANPASLPPARFADSRHLEVGQVVLAMGNPLGYQSTVTEGIVSALGRTLSEPTGYVLTDLIQTSAAINPGNSGGALVDLQDHVVGMPTLGAVNPSTGSAAPGLGFALSSNTVEDFAGQIIKNGKVVETRRASLDLQAGNVEGSQGVVVLEVQVGGAAAQAGVQVGDVITAINGNHVGDTGSLAVILAHFAPGSAVTLTVRRNGHQSAIKVTLSTLPAP